MDWQLISVSENRSQRVEAAAVLEGGTVVRIRRNPMPLEENLPCNKEGDRGPPLPQGDMCGKVMTAVSCEAICCWTLTTVDRGGAYPQPVLSLPLHHLVFIGAREM